MLPSDRRLLTGISDALTALAREPLSGSAQAVLAAAHIGINELLLRNDAEFFGSHRERGAALVSEGRRIAGERRWNVPSVGSDVSEQLAELVKVFSRAGDRGSETKGYLSRVVDWENDLYGARVSSSAAALQGSPVSTPEAVSCEALQKYMAAKCPESGPHTVSNVRVLHGGFSKKTVLFDVVDAVQGARSLVMRAEQPDALVFFDGSKTANEFRVLKLAWNAGLCVAEPLWQELDATIFGGSFFVSRKASGANIGSAVGSSQPVAQSLLQHLVENLVRIHDTQVNADDENVRLSHLGVWSQFKTVEACTRENVAYWEREVRKMKLPASPLAVRALEWLARNVPRCDEPPCFVHRDYGLHNVLVDKDRVTCILDWESASVGDPAEELSWFINALAGTFDRQAILDAYASAGGRRIPEFRLRYFDVFNALKFAVICSLALSIFERNRGASLDLCRLGLLYMHHGTCKLNDCIERADAEKHD